MSGTVQFTKSFKYLGSVINRDGTDDEDLENRIACASKIFGSRRFIFRTKKISLKNKGQDLCVLRSPGATERSRDMANPVARISSDAEVESVLPLMRLQHK